MKNQKKMDPLGGVWSQARLFREGSLDDTGACAIWCAKVGLIIPNRDCKKDRRACTLVRRSDRTYPEWYCGTCKSRTSALVGSIFEDLHMPLGRAIMLMYCYAHLTTYEEAQRAVVFTHDEGVASRHTIADWFGSLRDRLIDHVENLGGREGQIGGPGVIVQVDEAQIGRRKYERGRVRRDTWVLGLIDEAGQLRMEICSKRDANTLLPIIQKHCLPGSVIHTDGWPAYRGLKSLGYDHAHVNHSVEFVAPDGTHTQRIESQWRALRRRFHSGGLRHDDIGDHLIEYMWRRKCRQDGVDPFVDLVRILRAQ